MCLGGESQLILSAGVFFFTLALFGFSCLSSLGLFANERILFMRERCDLILMAVFRPPLTEHTNKIERILFFLHLLHIEGASSIFLWGLCADSPCLDSI